MSSSFSRSEEHPNYILERYVSVRGASAYTGYSVQYLRRLLRSGALEGTKIGQVWLIELDAFEHYIDLGQKRNDRRCGPRRSITIEGIGDHGSEVTK